MAIKLFPTVPQPRQISAGLGAPSAPAGSRVLKEWQFDFLRGDLTVLADGRIAPLQHPELVVAQEAVVTLMVERDAYRIYPRRFGMDYDKAMRQPRRLQAHANLERQVRQQLQRVRGVRQIILPRWLPGPSSDYEYFRFVVTMQAGLPRRTIQTLIPAPLGGN